LDDTLSSKLSIDELIQRCQQETNKYLAGHPHDETYCLELFRRAILNDNQQAWQAIYTQYQSLVADWIWQHSKSQSINEDVTVLINAAFMRFWRTVSKKNNGSFQFNSLGQLLGYFKKCVYSAIEDAYRQEQRWPQDTLIWEELSEALADDKSSLETRVLSRVEMDALEWVVWSRLRGEAEMIVARLSWLDGLSPREIQARRPDLFVNVRRVYRIKRNILERLLRDPKIQKLWKLIR
jgi:hypothetical protein